MNCLRDRTVKNDIHSCGPHPSKCIMEGCRSSVCTSVYPSQKAVHKKFKFDGNIPRFTFNWQHIFWQKDHKHTMLRSTIEPIANRFTLTCSIAQTLSINSVDRVTNCNRNSYVHGYGMVY